MQVPLYDTSDIAVTDTDNEGPCVITWLRDPSVRCDGWITGGILFAPRDGQASPGTYVVAGEIDPVVDAGWYAVATGEPAILINGIPHLLGSTNRID